MDDPAVWSRTGRVRVDREAIGYDDQTFLYEYGGTEEEPPQEWLDGKVYHMVL